MKRVNHEVTTSTKQCLFSELAWSPRPSFFMRMSSGGMPEPHSQSRNRFVIFAPLWFILF
jgi:hypothetical protein